jgi:hypothetical protein
MYTPRIPYTECPSSQKGAKPNLTQTYVIRASFSVADGGSLEQPAHGCRAAQLVRIVDAVSGRKSGPKPLNTWSLTGRGGGSPFLETPCNGLETA